jgi:hypothetical protein
MGALHPFEQGLVLLLAFGPFVVLGVVVWLRSREPDDEEERTEGPEHAEREPLS